MAVFSYRAHRLDGACVAGEVTAPSAQEALAAVREQGLFVSSLQAREAAPSRFRAALARWSRAAARPTLGRQRAQELLLCRQLAVLLRSGLPLYESLLALAGRGTSAYAALLRELAAGLAAGRTFSSALREHPRVFSRLTVEIVRVGERSGQLPEMMARLSDWLVQAQRNRERLQTLLLYPAVLFFLTVSFGLFLTFAVLPTLSALLLSFQVALPLPTRLLLAWSAFLQEEWPRVLLLLAGAMLAALLLLQRPSIAERVERLRFRLPLFGTLRRELEWLQIYRALAVLLGCGISLDAAVLQAADVTGSRYLRRRLQTVAVGIQQGLPLTELLAGETTLPPLLLEFLRAGETSGCLQEMLGHGAAYAEMLAENHAARLQALAEPVAYLIVFLFVAAFVAAVSLPILDMMLVV